MLQLVILVVALSSGVCMNLEADFSLYVSDYGQHYGRAELKARYNLFKTSKTMMTTHNKGDSSFSMAINKFSAMTADEKRHYTGLSANQTDSLPPQTHLHQDEEKSPESFDNTAAGYVTRPKDQRSCGSCWAFAATAAFEGAYARATGVLKSFSEKELLDCTYPDEDGCEGGWYHAAWNYIKKTKRLASLEDAPYDYAKDRGCGGYAGVIENGIKNAEYVEYHWVGREEGDLQQGSYKAVLAAAIVVYGDLFAYGEGIYDGCKPGGRVTHAVTITGYSQASWSVKNSWGRDWGEKGFVRFSRTTGSCPACKENICALGDWAKYPVVKPTAVTQPDEADSTEPRKRMSNTGCSFGKQYPCSDMNCSYGCSDGQCWAQCNGLLCGIHGIGTERCGDCKEWCKVEASCSKHEDCFSVRHNSCTGPCSI